MYNITEGKNFPDHLDFTFTTVLILRVKHFSTKKALVDWFTRRNVLLSPSAVAFILQRQNIGVFLPVDRLNLERVDYLDLETIKEQYDRVYGRVF